MRQQALLRGFAVSFIVLGALLLGQHEAYSQFDVDFGYSKDAGLKDKTGDELIAAWLVSNGYYSDFGDARNFANTGYIGYKAADSDPFYWSSALPYTIEVVQERAGYADYNVLGYYTGMGAGKNLEQLLGGTQDGPAPFTVNDPFGLYLGTPGGNLWFTGRGENVQQAGVAGNVGGDPQALIYELAPGTEWLITWEDLDSTLCKSDNDYNDMYARLSVAPEPFGGVLFLLGGGIFAAVRRRNRKRKQ
ncbi:MAG: hypothetical protein JW937_06715 [Candidatus Omnitrophica bacterium]|nr:hypothetical protein [Candidatus Omnitrophota bacterium]